MNDNTEIMDSYDDYDDDYESGVPENDEGVTDSAERTMDEQEAVMAILSGKDPGDYKAKANDSGTRVRDVDGSGNVVDRRGDRSAPAQEEGIHEKSEILYQDQINEAKHYAQAQWDQATQAYAKLQQDLQSGEIDLDTFNQQSYALGQAAGQARQMAYESELAGYRIREQRDQAHAELTEVLGEEAWGTKEAREETTRAVYAYCEEMGIDPYHLEGTEDAAIVRALATASKNHILVSEQKDKIAKQAAQIRQLKKARGEGRRQGRKASEAGVKGDKQDAMLNEVMAVLAGADKGGRRR